MTLLLLMLATHADNADAVLKRYSDALRAMPAFEVQVTYTRNKKNQVHADLIMDSKKRLFYHVTAPQIDYRLSVSPAGYVEVDRRTRTYDEFPYNGTAQVYQSRISVAQKTLPMWLTVPSIANLVPKDTKFSDLGEESVSGRVCDHVQAKFSTMMGKGVINCDIAKDGLIYQMNQLTTGMEGTVEQNWVFADYMPAKSFSQSRFANPVPDGFSPFALSATWGPLKVGSQPTLNGFVDPRSGAPWSVPAGRPLLLLVAGQDSPPSDKAVKQVSAWRSALREAGASLAIVSDATSRSSSHGLPFDPQEKVMKQLWVPATPTFFLLDKSGKISNLWMGFATEDAAKLRSDVLNAVSSLKK